MLWKGQPVSLNPPEPIKGRGASIQPASRFDKILREPDLEHLDDEEVAEQNERKPATVFLTDDTRSIISENQSPDLNFRYSLNPYRGCEHGCSYCYARPTHEYFGLSSGIDFESKILVKENAPRLFRKWLSRPAYEPDSISFSGVTDCYQPAEQKYRLTRECLKVADAANQPIAVITKNRLMLRDLDIVAGMAQRRMFRAAISITTLDKSLAQKMEPRTSTPTARLQMIRELSESGIPVMAMVAPVIPGLNDHEIPAILEAVARAGARGASYVLLRLPLAVESVFVQWLEHHYPNQAAKVLGRLQLARRGRYHSNSFGERMTGTGQVAEQLKTTFDLFRRKYGLDREPEPMDFSQFRRPESDPRQLRLF